MKIDEYLITHKIISIGKSISGYVCCEVIVDDPIELIDIVSKSNCFISEIRWWDCTEIEKGSLIGYGGPRDPRNPSRFFFAETDICKIFSVFSKEHEYKDHIKDIKSKYPHLDLFPAFDIKIKTKDDLRKS